MNAYIPPILVLGGHRDGLRCGVGCSRVRGRPEAVQQGETRSLRMRNRTGTPVPPVAGGFPSSSI